MRLIFKGPGCMVMIEVDRPSGLLARSGSCNMIQLALCHYMLCASYICVSVSSNQRWLNDLLDTFVPPSLNLRVG